MIFNRYFTPTGWVENGKNQKQIPDNIQQAGSLFYFTPTGWRAQRVQEIQNTVSHGVEDVSHSVFTCENLLLFFFICEHLWTVLTEDFLRKIY